MIKEIISKFRPTFDRLFNDQAVHLTTVGEGCPWNIQMEIFKRNPVVVSGGVGKDISFELQLADDFGGNVYLFDPSDTGISTMDLPENQRESISFNPIGLAAESKEVEFMVPLRAGEGSFTKATDGEIREKVSFRCISISDFLNEKELGEGCLLKLDIEGFEYEVISDVLNKYPKAFSQICVELHHFLPGHSLLDNWKLLYQLNRTGYKMVHKCRQDYLFVRRELIK